MMARGERETWVGSSPTTHRMATKAKAMVFIPRISNPGGATPMAKAAIRFLDADGPIFLVGPCKSWRSTSSMFWCRWPKTVSILLAHTPRMATRGRGKEKVAWPSPNLKTGGGVSSPLPAHPWEGEEAVMPPPSPKARDAVASHGEGGGRLAKHGDKGKPPAKSCRRETRAAPP